MKTNGLLTNIKGGCGEMAVQVGEYAVGQLVADATIEATVVGTGAAINTEKVTIDTNLEDLKNLQIAGTNSKGDVFVKISRDNVVIVYTVTVKEGKEHEIIRKLGDNSYLQQVLTAKLVDETPFLAAARKIYPDRYI
jgi:spore coat polysaccharide biosynthesis protein SpsF (cytidylyltransferase family)